MCQLGGAGGVNIALHFQISDRFFEGAQLSADIHGHTIGHHLGACHLQIVLPQVHGERQAIDVRRATLIARITRPRIDRHVMPIGRSPAGDRQLHAWEDRIDVLREVLVADLGIRDLQVGDQEVERLAGTIRVARRPRQVVEARLVDEVMQLNAFEATRLDDVATAQQLPRTEIDPRMLDSEKRWRVWHQRRHDAQVAHLERQPKQVVLKLVTGERDVLGGKQLRDLRLHPAAGRRGLQHPRAQPDGQGQHDRGQAEAPKPASNTTRVDG